MASSKLKLIGRYPAWGRGIRIGELARPDGAAQKILIQILQHDDASKETLSRLRDDAAHLARFRHTNALRIEHITAVGGHAALVLEHFECASMARALEVLHHRNQLLPSRAALEALKAQEESWPPEGLEEAFSRFEARLEDAVEREKNHLQEVFDVIETFSKERGFNHTDRGLDESYRKIEQLIEIPDAYHLPE